MSSDNKGTEAVSAEGAEVVLAAEKEEIVKPVLEGDSNSTQDANDESRSVPQIDSEGDGQQEQQQDGHDSHAGEEEDGGVKVHHEDEEEGGRGEEEEGDGDQNEHDVGRASKKGCDEHSQPPPPQVTEGAEGVEEGDGYSEEEEEEADDGQSDSEEEEEDAEDDTEQPSPGEEVIITPNCTGVGIESSQDNVENCTEAVKDPFNSSSTPPSPSVSPPPQQAEVEAPSPNDIPEPTELLPDEEEEESEDNKTDDNTGCDEAPDHTLSETAGEENNPNPAADTSAEESAAVVAAAAASAAPVYASDSIEPILEGEPQEQNANSEEQSDQEGEQVLVVDRDQKETLSSTDFAKSLDSSSTYQPERDNNNNNNHIIITVIYDINEPLPPPPAGYQTAITHPNPPVAEQIEHVGIQVVEEEIDATPAVDTIINTANGDDEPQDFPAPEPPQEEANPNDSLKTDIGELPGEVEPLPAAEELPSVEVPPPAYTPTEHEKDVTQDPIVAAPPIMSEVSALSNGTGSYKDATPPTLQQPFTENPFETSFAAGPLDDEAAAAAGAAALAMSAVGVPDGSRRSRKDKSHRKKDRPSGDGTEKERKHRDRGDRDRERAKSRDRGEKSKRDRSELGIGERRAKSRDRLRDDGKSRDRDRDSREKEKKHRTPEEKAEREARKAAKKSLTAPTPVYADIATAPYDQFDQQQYDTQYEEERRKKKASRRNGMIAGEFIEPQVMNSMEMPYEEERKEKKKSKKSRPPPIDTESTQQQYEQQQEEQLKRKKSSKKAAAILGEPIILNEPPMSPYIDGPIEQPKRKKSSKRSPPPDIGAEPVQVVYEPDARPPPANRRSRSDSLKNGIPGLINGTGEKKHHKKKDSAHLSLEEREKRRRKHEDDKALREGRELENHLYNGSKEKRKAEKAAQKAAKARAEALEGIPPPISTPRYVTDDLNLPIQNPDNQVEISPSVYGGDQYLQGQPHRDQQDLNAPNPEAPFSPRSFAAEDDLAKAEKAARRAERRARKEREARQTDGENPDHPKDSGHSLSSEGKREREQHHHKSRDKTDRTRSRSRPANPEEEEERRRRKEEKREARRLAALNGNEVRDGKEKKSKHREGGRARSNSEKKQEKDMMREYEIGYPEGYGNATQHSWQAGGDLTDKEDGKVSLMRRTFSKFLKF